MLPTNSFVIGVIKLLSRNTTLICRSINCKRCGHRWCRYSWSAVVLARWLALGWLIESAGKIIIYLLTKYVRLFTTERVIFLQKGRPVDEWHVVCSIGCVILYVPRYAFGWIAVAGSFVGRFGIWTGDRYRAYVHGRVCTAGAARHICRIAINGWATMSDLGLFFSLLIAIATMSWFDS